VSNKRPSESKTAECVTLLKDALRGVLFTDSTDEELDKVMMVMQRLVVPPESHVITQGDSGDKFYVVQSGSLEVIVNTAIVGYLTTGDHFGELALIYDGARAVD
jgi:CRP-like cAMP-binding protein